MSNVKAQAAKDKGNAAFRAGDYPLAIGHYTSALMSDPRGDPAYALNRAAAYLKLGKNEDAERDCTLVLDIHKNNVKALFRRGQARVGLGKLLEAQNDFTEVLRIEPANASARDEQTKLSALIQSEKVKKARMPTTLGTGTSPTTNGKTNGADSTPAPKRRRVPIRIVDPSSSTSTSVPASEAASTPAFAPPPKTEPTPVRAPSKTQAPAQPKTQLATGPSPQATASPKVKEKTAAPAPPSTLEAVSSRSLKAATSSPAPTSPPAPGPATTPIPPALAAAAAALKPVVTEKSKSTPPTTTTTTTTTTTAPPSTTPAAGTPMSFKDAKQARASAKPSRVGGGIFRSSGDSTIFAQRESTPAPSSASAAAPSANKVNGPTTMKSHPSASEALDTLITTGRPAEEEEDKMEVDGKPSDVLDELITMGDATHTRRSTATSATSAVANVSTNLARNAGTGAAPTNTTTKLAVEKNMEYNFKFKQPTTLFEFGKTWNGLRSVGERWGYVNTIPPTTMPKLCQTSLDPTLLASMLDVFLTVITSSASTSLDGPEQTKNTVRAYMENLARTPRFGTLVLMLSAKEKGVGKAVWEALGGVGQGEGVRKAWAGVGV